ncbi:MAG: aspartyl-tRNA(Asn)/glutamyl-tRNA(Gln) amidotransferase subunit A [Gammaproteobacteria bacterium]|jgi:aspartyl-tRNA(Asn)/glutamyl-tRNA(Gln) amidotransferase subunit A
MTDELCYLSIADSARRIAAHSLSPLELTSALLARIELLNPRLNAFIEVTAELALEQARAAESEIMRLGPRGPLHGMPFALKDIYDTRGIRTTGHSALLRDRTPKKDSECTRRLYAAGAVLMGKLATHEFATGGPAYDLPWPPACNPWMLDRFPGGSSSGSGAAVAAGLVPAALGSDTAGSIRLPAAFCGLAGLKPTYGRVSKRGVLPLSWTFDTCGPLTWTVEDAAIMLQAIAGHDARDPSTSTQPVPDFSAQLGDGVDGMRIGIVRHLYERDARASDATISAMNDAVETLRKLGAKIVEVQLPTLAQYQACTRVIIISEAFAIHGADLRARPDLYSAVTRYRIMPGALVAAADYSNALRFQRVLATRTLDAMSNVDALITASTYGPAPVQAQMRAESNFSNPPLTNPFNAAQLPALSLCNGFCADGLPLSMQIVGRPFDEATVLRIGHAYERATVWRAQRPQLHPGEPAIAALASDAKLSDVDAASVQRYRSRAQAAGLDLDDQQLADLCQAMPHLEAMIAQIPADRDYDRSPGTVYRW